MTHPITFFVSGLPVAQPRPRAFARRTGFGEVKAGVYNPKSADGWKRCIAMLSRECAPHKPIEGPVELVLRFLIPRPLSHFRTGAFRLMLKPTAPLFVDVKPDLDNLIKAAQDALNGVGFWTDDAQVACVMVTKRYVGPEQKSGCLIMIAPLEDRATQDPYEKQIQTALEVHAV